jgi:hypothetical protein
MITASLISSLINAQNIPVTKGIGVPLDTLRALVETSPGSRLTWYGEYNKRRLRKDKDVITFFGTVFNNNKQLPELYGELRKLKGVRIHTAFEQNGLIRSDKITFNTKNVHTELFLESIDSLVYRKKLLLTTTVHAQSNILQRVQDYRWVKDAWAPVIQAPFYSDYYYLVAEVRAHNNITLTADRHPDYVLKTATPGDAAWIDSLYAGQFRHENSCCYTFNKVGSVLKKLVKNEKWDVLKDLLYSPNYFYAVNAMEALLYGQNQQKVTLNNNDNQKILALKNATWQIISQPFDVVYTYEGYGKLKLTDEKVISKYKVAMEW